MTPRESLELHVPEPDPPRRSGCLICVAIIGVVLLFVLQSAIAAPGSAAVIPSPGFSGYREADQRSTVVLPGRSAGGSNPRATDPAPSPEGLREGASFRYTATATWCEPTPTRCQSWGGNAKLGAVNSFRDGDEPYFVKVSRGSRSVIVEVVSFCACKGIEQAIDLSPSAFKRLAPLSKGRIDVIVEGPVTIALPPTDTQ